MEVNKEIRQAVTTGNVVIGTNQSLKILKQGQAKLVIAATNCRPSTLADVKHHAELGGVPVHIFNENSRELGIACGSPFLVSVLAVVDPGSSDILSLGERKR